MSSTKTQVTLRDIYMSVFDAAVQHRTLTISDVAAYASLDVATAKVQTDALALESLIEYDASESDNAATIKLLCSDTERISRKSASDKFAETFKQYAVRQQQQAATAATERKSSTQRSTRTADDASKSAAQRIITLAEYATSKQTITVTTAKAHAFETQAAIEHRNEHHTATMCLCCMRALAHTTSVQFCSRCYNHARVATREVMHSTDSAVVRHMRSASEDQLTRVVELTRESLAITVSKLSARAVAKLMQQSLAESAS